MRQSIKKYCQSTHSAVGLANLSENERSGWFGKFTRFKLVPRTLHTLPMAIGRSVRGISSDYKNNDPLHEALSTSSRQFDKKMFRETLLKSLVYEKTSVVSDYNSFINKRHWEKDAWSIVFPWDNASCDFMYENYLGLVEKNRQEFAHKTFVSNKHKIDYSLLVDTHSIQFANLYKKIKKFGFNENLQRPQVNVLIRGNSWIWMMTGQGNHRFYIMNVLGYDYFPCEIRNVVDYDNLKKFENVKNGDYTLSDAKYLIDKIFDGKTAFRGIL